MPHLNHLKAGIGSIEGHVDAVLSELETVLGHGFTSPGLLVRALTHRSLAKERAASEQGLGVWKRRRKQGTMSGWSFWEMQCWDW